MNSIKVRGWRGWGREEPSKCHLRKTARDVGEAHLGRKRKGNHFLFEDLRHRLCKNNYVLLPSQPYIFIQETLHHLLTLLLWLLYFFPQVIK